MTQPTTKPMIKLTITINLRLKIELKTFFSSLHLKCELLLTTQIDIGNIYTVACVVV